MIENKLSSFVDNMRGVWEVSIHENASNGNRTTAESVLSSTCTVPLIFADRNKTYADCNECALNTRCEILGISLQWKPKYSRKVSTFPSKTPSTMVWSQPNLCVEWPMWIFRKIPPIEAEIQPRRYIVFQVKYWPKET